jgi:hypothetical protein
MAIQTKTLGVAVETVGAMIWSTCDVLHRGGWDFSTIGCDDS